MLFGMGVFLVTSLLHSADVSMGFAFGLFAVFSMLRYRTESISIKEMTYLFLVIAIALLSAVSTMKPYELFTITLSICLVTYLLETNLVLPSLDEIEIDYEKIENINTQRQQELIQDINLRTGLDVQQVEILSIDFLRDSARLKIHFSPTNIKKSEQVDRLREHHV
jgi:predicted membrane protein